MRSRVLAEILALVAPPVCVACRVALDDPGAVLCGSCRRALPWLQAPLCPRCALPKPCSPCPAHRAAFNRAWAPLEHRGPARQLVNALKFGGALGVADLMAAQLAAGAPDWIGRTTALVPVPAHPTRRRARGFDQAVRLAKALSARTGLPLTEGLSRGGPAERQLGATRARRRTPGRIAIEVKGEVPLTATLVDDVHTTGATLDACARALRRGGAQDVMALTYSRTLNS
jgi:predicted amidophosphoribosyltransferase